MKAQQLLAAALAALLLAGCANADHGRKQTVGALAGAGSIAASGALADSSLIVGEEGSGS